MEQQKKQACVLFRTIVEAAKEMDKEEALELLLTYADYAMGDTDDIETDNKYVKLILKQLVPALSAAEKRYEAACKNGPKGKEHGKKGGRPRKGETKEEAYERRNPSKTPEQSPEETPVDIYEKTPVKPLEVEEEVDIEKEEYIDKDIYTEVSKESLDKYLDNLCSSFIRKHQDYNYLLDADSFKNHYYDNVYRFQRYLNEQLNTDITVDECCKMILFMQQNLRCANTKI